MASTSPTVRSLAILRKEKYKAQVVEKWLAYGNCRVDLFGFIDIVAIREGELGVVGVQTTSQSNVLARFKKIIMIPEAFLWINTGNRILLHGWAKKGEKGKRKLWQVSSRFITKEDFYK